MLYIYIPSMDPKEITAVGVDFGGQGEITAVAFVGL